MSCDVVLEFSGSRPIHIYKATRFLHVFLCVFYETSIVDTVEENASFTSLGLKFENSRSCIKLLHKSKTMSSTKKRKAEERTFLKKWEEDYLFVENNGKPLCLACQKQFQLQRNTI